MIIEKEESMSGNQFIPDDFEIPALLETDRFRLRMLSTDDVEKDYEAVIESQELLHTMFGGPWPRPGFTLRENLADLQRHQQEFLDRKAFAYTVVSLDESRVLGCVYINLSDETSSDAVVFMWVRKTEYDKGLDEILFNTVRDWIRADWPFRKVNYPGRV
jgi:RimJ/RimL family protein N-acetyltransferase